MSLAIKPKRVSPAGTIPAGADLGESEIAVNWADGSIHTKRGGTVVSFYFVSGRTSDAISEGSVNLYFTTARAAAAAPVQQVAGRTGSITLTSSDIGGLGPLATLTTSGTASSSTYLRGDGQWTAVSSGTTYTAGSGITIASGTISAAVTQVAGRTGSITLTVADIGGLGSLATQSSVAYSSLTGTPSTFSPSAHKVTHATGGSDALTAADIGAAASSHVHGNITSAGAIGSTASQIVVTTTGGVLTTAATIAASAVSGLAASATTDTTSAANISSGTLSASRLPTSGVTAGTYTSVTVDTYGRVTAGSNPSSGGKSLGLILALT